MLELIIFTFQSSGIKMYFLLNFLLLNFFLIPNSFTSPIITVPGCKKVCSHLSTFKEPTFTMSIWTIICQDLVCVIKSKGYSRHEIPRNMSDKETPKVFFDLKLLKLTGVNFNEDSLDIGLWVGMEWEDMNLSMCNCRNEEQEYQVDMDLEADIWVPDLAFYSWKKIERVSILTPNKQFLVQKRNGKILIYFSMDLRSTVMCPFKATHYPFDRNLCYVRVGSYSHSDQMLKFVRNSFSSSNIIYKDMKVYPKALCNEEAGFDSDGKQEEGTLDGFKIIFNREGRTMKTMYIFTMNLFLITAGLASLLPSNPIAGVNVDKSGPIIEVVISSYYILFDLLSQTPIDNLGQNMLVGFVSKSNYFVYSTVIIYFTMLYIRRFGKMTFHLSVAGVRFIVKGWGRVVMRIRGEVVVREEDRDVEDDVIVEEDEDDKVIDMICYVINKTYFMVLMLAYWGFSNHYWLKQEIVAISNMHHNRMTGETCTCEQECSNGHGGH